MIKFFSLLLLSRGLIVVLHEFGHAIPAVLLTRQKVSVYIGSYGNPDKSIHFKIGLFDIWLSYELLSWRTGMCAPSAEEISVNRRIVYVLCGPLTSTVCGILFLSYAFVAHLSDPYFIAGYVFLLLAMIDLFVNLVPDPKPIQLFNGEISYNDGHTLSRLFKIKKFPKRYTEAISFYNAKKYPEAIACLDELLHLTNLHIYPLNISSNIQIKNYERAKVLFDDYNKSAQLSADDYSNGGLIYNRLDLNEEALAFYDQSLALNPNHIYSLNNKGYTLNILERYAEAIPLFDKSLENNAAFAYSYNNRGLAKIKTGNMADGLADIEKSIALDPNNSYAYRNLGIYHFDIGETDKARALFFKSKAIDGETPQIDELILSTENG